MSLLPAALVTASGIVHATWNLWAKRSRRPLLFLWSFQWVAVAVYGPFAAWSLAGHPLPPAGLLLLLLTIALHGVYVLLLGRSYALGDLSQVYPLMRGTSPLLVPLFGVLSLGERLQPLGWIGALLVVLGVLCVGGGPRPREIPRRTAYIGLAVGLAIASYTLVDKLTLHYVPAIALNALSNAGNLVFLTPAALCTKDALGEWRKSLGYVLLAGVLSPLSYLLFLWALQRAPVAQLAPMREVSIVFGTLFGIYVLHEARGRSRVVGSLLIAAGAIALSLGA